MILEISIAIVSLISGYVAGFITSYLKEKGKNRALIEDLKIITEEKEKITSKYQLEISKRQYKYEDKRLIYFKYFNLLDELNTEGTKISQQEMLPAINKFMKEHLNANGDNKKILRSPASYLKLLKIRWLKCMKAK